MNREILFRGKIVENGAWVYGNYIKAGYHWHNKGKHEDWIASSAIQNGGMINLMGRFAVIPDTVGQFTGLCDKNGNKIFEGDIVKVTTGLEGYKSTYHSTIHRVTYDVCNCGVAVFYPFDNSDMIETEVIGNIYDNLELLEVEQ